jgi:hypothetical protein
MNNEDPNTKPTSLLDVTTECDDFQSTLALDDGAFLTARVTLPTNSNTPLNVQKLKTQLCRKFVELEERNVCLAEKVKLLDEKLSKVCKDHENKQETHMKTHKLLEEKKITLTEKLQVLEKEIQTVRKSLSIFENSKGFFQTEEPRKKNNTGEKTGNGARHTKTEKPRKDEAEELENYEEDTNVKCINLPIANRYEILEIDAKQPHQTQPKRPCETPINKKDLPVELIMDSHGKWLDPKWIYRNKEIKITVLDTRKKNINGAMEQIRSVKSPKHLIIGVGCNDLSRENSEDV